MDLKNSMILANMMRKKEEIMYATIKGTLTENDGVFSGFSTSNYLEIQGLYDFSKPFEIKTKIHLNSNPNASSFIKIDGSSTGYGVIMISQTLAIGVYIGANDGTTIFSANVTPNNTIPINKDVFIRFVFTGTEYAIYVSVDNTETKYLIATTSKVIGSNKYILLGANPPNQSFAIGTIDLNKTNIKLGSTKYKLQAVVGYTIVGSPTITDGVVSGFSSANYLRLSGISKFNQYEYKIKFRINSLANGTCAISGTEYLYSRWGFNLQITSSNKRLYSYLRYLNNETWQTSNSSIYYEFQINVDYYAKVILKDNTYQIFISLDNINWIEGNKAVIPDGVVFSYPTSGTNNAGSLRLGAGTQYAVFDGSIDLNETYIKINNKLWFNGQQS